MVDFVLNDADVITITALAQQTPVWCVGGNSSIAQVKLGDQSYAVKDYSARADGKQRLNQEFAALEVLHPKLPYRFAAPLGIGPDGVRAIYSWVPGIRPSLDQQTVAHMIEIGSELHHLSKSVKPGEVRSATDQVLGFSDIRSQVESRFELLAATPGQVGDYVKTQNTSLVRLLNDDDREVGHAALTLSPSDFGAHNLLWDEPSGQMKCVDLEFFGWDDAHKLICDSLLHPLARWTDDCAETFLAGTVETYQLDTSRLKWLWPLLNLKWTAITLSRAEREAEAGNQILMNEAMQRAEMYLSRANSAPHSLSDIVQQVAITRGSL